MEYCGWFVYASASIPLQPVPESIPVSMPTVPLSYSPKPSPADLYLDKFASSLVLGSVDGGRIYHDVDERLRQDLDGIGECV